MERLLSITRAAKLVGVSRGALQQQIHNGELESFEGNVLLDDVARLYPQAQLEDNSILENIENIIESALKRARGEKLAKLLSPDTSTLTSRLAVIHQELMRSKQKLGRYENFMQSLMLHINELEQDSQQAFLFEDLKNWIEDQLADIATPSTTSDSLMTKDLILRVMAAQVKLLPSQHEFLLDGNTSILEAGLSAGLALNYGCSNGNCGKCKARLVSGKLNKIRRHDYVLTDAEKLQGYFLCCSNTALTDVVIEADEAGGVQDIPQQQISAKVKSIEKLSDAVTILNLKTPRTNRLRFLAGQTAILQRADLGPCEMPIASCPCDDRNIQFHIHRDNNSAFARYVFEHVHPSDSIEIIGPNGNFVLREDSVAPALFIAFDTGFAPIKSLIEHAITLENAARIRLAWFHSEEQPYLHNLCRAWEDALDSFDYHPVHYHTGINLADSLRQLLVDYPDKRAVDIYLCGLQDFVSQTIQALSGQQITQQQIVSDIV